MNTQALTRAVPALARRRHSAEGSQGAYYPQFAKNNQPRSPGVYSSVITVTGG